MRNQVDYIIATIEHKAFVTKSRSYSGIQTEADHTLVLILNGAREKRG